MVKPGYQVSYMVRIIISFRPNRVESGKMGDCEATVKHHTRPMDSNQEPVGIRRAPDREAQEEKGLQPFSKVPRFGPRRLIRMFFGGFGFLLCLWQGAHGLWSLWSPGHTSTRQSSRLQTVANGSVTHVQWDEVSRKCCRYSTLLTIRYIDHAQGVPRVPSML